MYLITCCVFHVTPNHVSSKFTYLTYNLQHPHLNAFIVSALLLSTKWIDRSLKSGLFETVHRQTKLKLVYPHRHNRKKWIIQNPNPTKYNVECEQERNELNMGSYNQGRLEFKSDPCCISITMSE